MTGPRTALRSAVAAATLAACVACSSVVAGTPSPVEDPAPAPAADGSSAGGSTDVDPCALVTAADLAPLVGDAQGRPTAASYTGICDWKGGGNSVEIVVGAVGSAPGDQVPDDPVLHPQPIGDGLSATSGGLVEFAAGERVFIVAVDVGGKPDRDRAVELARTVRGHA